ncbi:thiol-activated cytolysin family protein [Deinococcus sp.]|uniref:thiol-activated cytolysin family protein n=1 Tax=Deinococcus sp. TaxID=47478 RepID=UPI003CC5A37B
MKRVRVLLPALAALTLGLALATPPGMMAQKSAPIVLPPGLFPLPKGDVLVSPTPAPSKRKGPDLQGSPLIYSTRDLDTTLKAQRGQGPVSSPQLADIDFATQSVCTTQNWGESEVRTMSDLPLLDSTLGTLYPGALVQGADLEQTGRFTPITVPRAGGTLVLQGVTVGGTSQYSKTLPEIRPDTVKQAVEDMLGQGIQGTAATLHLFADEVSDYNSVLFNLGLDARFAGLGGMADIKSRLGLNASSLRTRYLIKFIQPFYQINFSSPTIPTAVFRDGEGFVNAGDQISADNPPLYVSSVSYGRAVFLLAETDASKSELDVAFNAAYTGPTVSASANLDVAIKKTLDHTQISYYAYGGSAAAASGAIGGGNALDAYNGVRNLLANPAASQYSAANPGVPIGYTLSYLKNNAVARTSFSVITDKRNCTVTSADGRWTGVPTGDFTQGEGHLFVPREPRNVIHYEIKRRAAPLPAYIAPGDSRPAAVIAADNIQFVLNLGPGINGDINGYDKWLQLRSNTNNALIAEIQVTPRARANSFLVARSQVTANTHLVLLKDNFIGGPSESLQLPDLEYLRGGDQVSITWVREQN